jgi:hypothetical protein
MYECVVISHSRGGMWCNRPELTEGKREGQRRGDATGEKVSGSSFRIEKRVDFDPYNMMGNRPRITTPKRSSSPIRIPRYSPNQL